MLQRSRNIKARKKENNVRQVVVSFAYEKEKAKRKQKANETTKRGKREEEEGKK